MSILTALPGIAPVARSFVMDQWPQSQAKMRNGRTVRWAQVNSPAGASLELAWENITYAQAETLLAVWDANYGIYGNVDLVTANLAGLSVDLAGLIDQPFPNAGWRFQGPPTVEAVKARRCTVRLPLRARQGAGGGAAPPVALRILQAQSGALTLAGGIASLGRSRSIAATPGALTAAGGNATLRRVQRYLKADPGALTLTGGDATTRWLRVYALTASPGELQLAGGNANMSKL